MPPPDKQYITNVYTALKENLPDFYKTPQEFESLMTSDSAYRSKAYAALKDNIEGFDRTPAEFDERIIGKQAPEPVYPKESVADTLLGKADNKPEKGDMASLPGTTPNTDVEKLYQALPAMKAKKVREITQNNLLAQGKIRAEGKPVNAVEHVQSDDYNREKQNVESGLRDEDWMPSFFLGDNKAGVKKLAVENFSAANKENPQDVESKLDSGDYILEDGKVKVKGGFVDNLQQGTKDFLKNIGLALNVAGAQANKNTDAEATNEIKYHMNQFFHDKTYDKEYAATDLQGQAGKLLGGIAPYTIPYADIPLMGLSNLGSNHQEIWGDPTLTDEQKARAIINTSNDAFMIGAGQAVAFGSLHAGDQPLTAKQLLSQYAPTSNLKQKFVQGLYDNYKALLKPTGKDMVNAASVGAGTELLNNLNKAKEGVAVDFKKLPEAALDMATLDLVMKAPKVLTTAFSTIKEARRSGVDKVHPAWFNNYSKQTQDALNNIVSAPEAVYNEAIAQLDKSPDVNAVSAKQKIETFRNYYKSLPADLPEAAKSKALHILQLKTEAMDDARNASEPGIRKIYENRALSYDGLLQKVVEDKDIDPKKEPLLIDRFATPPPPPKQEAPPKPKADEPQYFADGEAISRDDMEQLINTTHDIHLEIKNDPELTQKLAEKGRMDEVQPTEEQNPLTQSAIDLLNNIKAGSKPAFVTKSLEKIAKDNGIEVTGATKPDDIINALKEKRTAKAEPQEPKPVEVVQAPKVKPVAESKGTVNDFNGKEVAYNGETGTLAIDEGGKVTIETPKKIYEVSDAKGDSKIEDFGIDAPEPKYTVSKISNDAATVNDVEYKINTDDKGNVVSVSPVNKPEQQIKNNALVTAVEIERNKQDVAEIHTAIDNNAAHVEKTLVDNGLIHPNAVNSLLNVNMTATVDRAMTKLDNGEPLTDQEALQLETWAFDAIDRLSKHDDKATKETQEGIHQIIEHLHNTHDKGTSTKTDNAGNAEGQKASPEKQAEAATPESKPDATAEPVKEITSPTNTDNHALSESSARKVLQREPEKAGSTGSERGGVEQKQQGNAPAGESGASGKENGSQNSEPQEGKLKEGWVRSMMENNNITRQEALDRLEKHKPEFVTLYRGEGDIVSLENSTLPSHVKNTKGRWFTKDRKVAEDYAKTHNGKLYAVQVPKTFFENLSKEYNLDVTNGGEVLLPRTVADNKVDLTENVNAGEAGESGASGKENGSPDSGTEKVKHSAIPQPVEEKKAASLASEVKKLPLSHVSGLGMGTNQADGTYISTEKGGNRYDKSGTAQKVKVAISKPVEMTWDGVIELQNELLNKHRDQFEPMDFEMLQVPTGKMGMDDLRTPGVNKLAKMVTEQLKSLGYDSMYMRESATQEGQLVVFDRKNVKFEQTKEKPKSNVQKATEIEDLTEPRDLVLQHFIAGGKIHSSAIVEILGDKKSYPESEKRARIGLLSKTAPGLDGLAHKLMEADPTGKFNERDYKNAIEQVILDHNSTGSMANDLVSRYIDAVTSHDLTPEEHDLIGKDLERKVHEHVNNLPEAEQQELIKILEKYQRPNGTIDWKTLQEDSDGFDPDILSLSDKAQKHLDEALQKNLEPRQGEHGDAPAENGSSKEGEGESSTSTGEAETGGIKSNWNYQGEGDAFASNPERRDGRTAYITRILDRQGGGKPYDRAKQRGELDTESPVTYDVRDGWVGVTDGNGNTVGVLVISKGGVEHIAVAPEFQRRGIASAMIEKMRQSGRKIDFSKSEQISPDAAAIFNKLQAIHEPITNKEKAKELADKWREAAKFIAKGAGGDGTMMMDITAIPRFIISKAIEGAAKIIEASGSVADAIADVRAKLKKFADDNKIKYKEEGLDKATVDLLRKHGMLPEPAPTVSASAVKKAVSSKMTGTRAEKEGLKKQIKDFARGYLKGANDGTLAGQMAAQIAKLKEKHAVELQKAATRSTAEKDALALRHAKEIAALEKESQKRVDQSTVAAFGLGKEVGTDEGIVTGVKAGVKRGSDIEKAAQEKFAKDVAHYLKGAMFDGKLTETQAKAIARRAAKVGGNMNRMVDFMDYVDKVVDDVHYAEKIAEANKLQKQIRKYSNSDKTFANNVDILNALKRIPINKLQPKDLDTFMQIANEYKVAQLNPTDQRYLPFNTEKNAALLEKVQTQLQIDADNADIAKAEELSGVLFLSADEARTMLEALKADDVDKFADKLSEAKQKQLSNALLQRAGYSQMSVRQSLLDSDYLDLVHPFSLKALTRIAEADLTGLNNKHLIEVIKGLDNALLNGTVANIGRIDAMLQIHTNLPELEAKTSANLKFVLNKFSAAVDDLPVLMKAIYGKSATVAEFRRMTGWDKTFDGGSKAKTDFLRKVKEYDAFLAENKISNKPDDVLRRGMYGHAIQHEGGTPEEIQTQFDNNKKLIKDSIKSYAEAKSTEDLAKRLQVIYDEHFEHAKTLDDLVKHFNEMPDEFVRQSMFGQVTAHDEKATPQEIQQRFDDNKQALLNDIKKYSQFKSTEYRAKQMQKLYDTHFEPFKTLDDLKKHFEPLKLSKDYFHNTTLNDDVKAHGFWEKTYADLQPELKYITEAYHNEFFEGGTINYTPRSYNFTDRQTEEPGAEKMSFNNYVNKPTQNANSITRTVEKNLPAGMALDFNFDYSMLKQFKRAKYDIHTTEGRFMFSEFTKAPESKGILGGVDNKRIITDQFQKAEAVQRGNKAENDAASNIFRDISGALRNASSAAALGGFTAYAKQYPSVMVKTLGTLGGHAGLFFEVQRVPLDDLKILEQTSIIVRGLNQGGTNTGNKEEVLRNKQMVESVIGRFGKGLSSFTSNARALAMKSLEEGDVRVAKRSFLAYYMKYLKEKGIDIKASDLVTEHERLDKVREEALAYAQQMVDESQVVSNNAMMSDFKRPDGNWYKDAVKGVLLPFNTFASNTRTRLIEDVRMLYMGDREQKKEAWKDIWTSAAEVIAYQGINTFVLQALVKYPMHMLIDKIFGLDDSDGKSFKEIMEFERKKFFSNSLKDFVFGGIGNAGEGGALELINQVTWLVHQSENPTDKTPKHEWMIKNAPMFVYDKVNPNLFDRMGAYGVFGNQLWNLKDHWKAAIKGIGRADNSYYNEASIDDAKGFNQTIEQPTRLAKDVQLTTHEQVYMMWQLLWNVALMFGVNDADIKRVHDAKEREILRKENKATPTNRALYRALRQR